MAASARGSREGQEYLGLQEGMQPGVHARCGPNSLQGCKAGSSLPPHTTMNVKYTAIWSGWMSSRGMPGAVGLGPPPQEPVFRWEPWRSCAEAAEESALAIAAGGGGSLGVVGMDAWGHTTSYAPSLSAQ